METSTPLRALAAELENALLTLISAAQLSAEVYGDAASRTTEILHHRDGIDDLIRYIEADASRAQEPV